MQNNPQRKTPASRCWTKFTWMFYSISVLFLFMYSCFCYLHIRIIDNFCLYKNSIRKSIIYESIIRKLRIKNSNVWTRVANLHPTREWYCAQAAEGDSFEFPFSFSPLGLGGNTVIQEVLLCLNFCLEEPWNIILHIAAHAINLGQNIL